MSKEQKINEDVLTCEICFQPFSADPNSPLAPKAMKCLHTFCKDCLAKAIAQTPGATQVDCFVCREPTPIDKALGVESLKTNFMVQNLVSIMTSGGAGGNASASINANVNANANANATVFNTSTSVGALSLSSSSSSVAATSVVNNGEGFGWCDHCPEGLVTHTCLQCEDEVFCANCSEVHKKARRFKGHECVLISSSSKMTSRKCSVHTSKTLEYVCMTCDPKVLLCMTCEIDNSHKDRGHKVI